MNEPEYKDGVLTFDVPLSPPFTFSIDNLQKLMSLYRCFIMFKTNLRSEGINPDIPVINEIVDSIELFRPRIIEEEEL